MNIEPKLDLTKPVQTRNGHAARIIATDVDTDNYPILALVRISNREQPLCYMTSGRFKSFVDEPDDLDLINIPEPPKRYTRWVNFHLSLGGAYDYSDKAAADSGAAAGRLACIEVEFTEGQGL